MARTPLPPLDELKAQAKALRAALADTGDEVGHGRALELVAHQHGYRDWNTLHAAVGNRPPPPLHVGMRVAGTYLGQPFHGEVIALALAGERYRVTLRFDDPVDVVTFDSFSNFRSRVTATVDRAGRTAERTADGQPHMVLEL
ncbi:MAG: glyoxalase superfamily protein [Alphaproteobacteria bacterium]